MTSGLGLFDSFYIVIDALNETPEQQVILSTVLRLCQSCQNLRVLTTCTLDPIEKSDRIYERKMAVNAIDHDIKTYVRYRLSTEQSFRLLSVRTQDEIQSTVTRGADGT